MMFDGLYKGKKVLVTGHTGFKGSWLCEWLLELGAEVSGFALPPHTEPSLFKILKLEKRLESRFGDIRDLGAVKECLSETRPDVVFHMAAQAIVRDSYEKPKETFDVNVGGTVNILEAIRNTPSVQAVVVVTTDKCYENQGVRAGYKETDPLGGKDPYSASKAAAELVAHSYSSSFFIHEKRVRLATARAGNVIGGGDWSAHRIVPDCVQAVSQGRDLKIRNPGFTRPWQHVLDSLNGYLLLGASLLKSLDGVVGEPFNFGPAPADSRTVEDLVREFQKRLPQVTWSLERSDDLKKEAPYLHLNNQKAFERLGWKSSLDFQKTVELTADWYKSFIDGADVGDLTRRQIGFFEDVTVRS